MEKITVENETTTITLEADKFIRDGIHMNLGFRPKHNTGRIVVSVTIEDLCAIEHVISDLRNQLILKKLKSDITIK